MVELELLGVSQVDEHQFPLVLLRHENQVLPIVVGVFEADAINRQLVGERPPRPMTHDLICNILAGLHGHLNSVTIYKLENDTFFAHLNIEQRDAQGNAEQVLRIDTRPSDGIAVAVRMGCPILAADEVMELAGRDASILTPDDSPEDEEDESFE